MGEVLLDDDPVIDRSNQLHPPRRSHLCRLAVRPQRRLHRRTQTDDRTAFTRRESSRDGSGTASPRELGHGMEQAVIVAVI